MKKGFIAGMAGPALVTTPGGGNDFIYGGRIGYTLGQSKDGAGSLGVSVNTVTESETVSGITVDARITVIMAEYVARQAFGTGLYFGGRMGFSMNRANISANGNSLSTSDTVFAYAPVVGFEAPLAGSARLMLDASWVNTNGGTFKLAGTSIPYQRTAFVALQAGILIDF